jgi:hypothetical protein
MAAEFFPRVPSCHHHHVLSFRSTSIFKATQERGKRRREGWEGDGRRCTRVPLGSSTEVCLEGEHEKEEMLFDYEMGLEIWNWGGRFWGAGSRSRVEDNPPGSPITSGYAILRG